MVDIIIGATQNLNLNNRRLPSYRAEQTVEAKVLDFRPSRKGYHSGNDIDEDRRDSSPLHGMDPTGSNILVLMLPPGSRVPLDIKTGNYKITLKITPDKI